MKTLNGLSMKEIQKLLNKNIHNLCPRVRNIIPQRDFGII
jgi:hypothetical protein